MLHIFSYCTKFLVKLFLILIIVLIDSCNGQFIYDAINTCEYRFNDKTAVLPNREWTVNYLDQRIIFAICGNLSKYFKDKKEDVKAYMLNANDKDKYVNAGYYFEIDQNVYENHENQATNNLQKGRRKKKTKIDLPIVLVSRGGSPCETKANKTYTLFITIDTKLVDKEVIELKQSDGCHYEITLTPNVQPMCTKLHNGNLIDYRHFQNKELIIKHKNRTFALAICGIAKSCSTNEDASACEIKNEQIVLLGNNNQTINLDNNKVAIQTKWGHLNTIVQMTCNWHVDSLNGKYLEPSKQGKNYKFEIESKYGCVKFPMKTTVRDDMDYSYDLSKLNAPSGWKVTNVTTESIILNVFGPLKKAPVLCLQQHSQICLVNGSNTLNYGSILHNLIVENDLVIADFIGGDRCLIKPNQKLTSKITFECAYKEMGPRLVDVRNCSLDIRWRTPTACPLYKKSSLTCEVNDLFGNRNINNLYNEKDQTHVIDDRNFIRFSICGKLSKPCNNMTSVSVCLHSKDNEYVLGYFSKTLEVDYTSLYMELKGDICKAKTYQRNITIYFHCEYIPQNAIKVKLEIKEDNCVYIMHIYTSSACSSRTKSNCIVQDKSNLYNLTSLALTDRNYVVKGANNVTLVINICNALVTKNVLCSLGAGACLVNNTEPNIKKKFISLGQLGDITINNFSITAKFKGGHFCIETLDDIRANVKFICSSIERLRFKQKEVCEYEIIIETKSVCQQQTASNCTYMLPNKSLNLNSVENHKIAVNLNTKFKITLDLCSKYYVNESEDIGAIQMESTLQMLTKTNRYYLSYKLPQRCGIYDQISINIYLNCMEDLKNIKDSYYTLIDDGDCIYNLDLKSRHLCKMLGTLNSRNVKDCIVGNSVPLSMFGTLKVENFTINLNSFEICPMVSYNCDDKAVKLNYFDETENCASYHNELWLKCNETYESPSVTNIAPCSLKMVYPTESACNLLDCKWTHTYTSAIIGGVFSILIIIVILGVAGFYIYKRRKGYISFNKEDIPIYRKNATV